MNAWLFDVDGVITNPQEKRVTEPEILNLIAGKLQKGEPVALVTGRSLEFIKERVISFLAERLSKQEDLDNFMAVGEKGGVWINYKNGKEIEEVDLSISMPKNLISNVRSLINGEFSDTMFFDETKKTMISTEMKDEQDLMTYHSAQGLLVGRLKNIIDQASVKDLEIDPTTIATDVQSKKVGKDFATRRVVNWLSEKGASPQLFLTFGDSRSDISMAEEINNQGLMVKMIFVGKPEDINELDMPFKIIKTNSLYDKGTLEFLQNF